MRISGIYKIEDKESRMVYIGLSTDLIKRWENHIHNFFLARESINIIQN